MVVQNAHKQYLDILEKENARQNLIRYQTRDELVKKHLEDSLLPYEHALLEPLNGQIIDIGSGGGFPAIPLAIIFNTASFTLIESEKRKYQFLKKVVQRLDLKNTTVINQRVEDFSKETRERYDYCTMRAVAATRVCLEYAAPSLKVGGKILLYKGPSFEDELDASQNVMKTLGIEFVESVDYQYTYNGEQFCPVIAIFRKNLKTPHKFPRRPGMAKKRPL